MKIAIVGNGRMGKAIAALAIDRGHSIITIGKEDDLRTILKTEQPEVAIEFTQPEAAPDNLRVCIEMGVPVVCGTTGWQAHLAAVEHYCTENNGTLFIASNFSLGVNLFFRLNEFLAGLMGSQNGYEPAIREVHHTGKKDAPSGTAITLAEAIIKRSKELDHWSLEAGRPGSLVIRSERMDPVPGTHTVTWSGPIDDIEITHTAHSRMGFASGALAVAEWMPGRKGLLSMADFLPF